MNSLNTYKIPLNGLKEGDYQYSYTINKYFFSTFPESEIQDAALEIEILLSKKTAVLNLEIELKGTVNIQCDRCLDLFDYPVNYRAKLYVKFGDKNSDLSDADETITLAHSEYELELSQHLYDYIMLSLPYKKVHPTDENGESTCNEKMLDEIEKFGNTDNPSEEKKEIDPRWDKLKGLIK